MRLLFILLIITKIGYAQIDSAIAVPIVGIHVGGQLPAYDMAQRFGPNLFAGGLFMYKTKSNWLFGLEGSYLFGRNVKEDVLSQLKVDVGNNQMAVIDNEGYPADIRVTERGLKGTLFAGRVFKFFSSNPNSGLMVTIGAGYLQHKINLYDAQQKNASIKGNLVYGYDRLSNGLALSQFVGYLFLSENRLLNFYFGVEATQGFTKSVRKLNYDTGLPDTKQRLDGLYGLKFGWVLPLYKKTPNAFYYN
jgi:hypothetical protein